MIATCLFSGMKTRPKSAESLQGSPKLTVLWSKGAHLEAYTMPPSDCPFHLLLCLLSLREERDSVNARARQSLP